MPFEWTIKRLVFTGHALRQMFARKIQADEVHAVVDQRQVIVEYPDEKPYPCLLLVGQGVARALHVVLAYDSLIGTGHVVTVYEPDADRWTEDFRTRRRS